MFNHKYRLNQAVLEERKTQTRRFIRIDEEDLIRFQTVYYNQTFDLLKGKDLVKSYFYHNPKKIPYKVGEVVAIAQSYYEIGLNPNTIVGTKKDGTPITAIQSKGWGNKMFVKAEFMPHQIRITNVRIQELQDITNNDCLAEGVRLFTANGKNQYVVDGLGHFRSMGYTLFDTPKEAYAALIDKIGKKGDWESNPFVFVYDFELIK